MSHACASATCSRHCLVPPYLPRTRRQAMPGEMASACVPRVAPSCSSETGCTHLWNPIRGPCSPADRHLHNRHEADVELLGAKSSQRETCRRCRLPGMGLCSSHAAHLAFLASCTSCVSHPTLAASCFVPRWKVCMSCKARQTGKASARVSRLANAEACPHVHCSAADRSTPGPGPRGAP